MNGDARFSPCGSWRWWLTRIWDADLPMCAFIGMNPSKATATKGDHTVDKEIVFAQRWKFGGLLKLNAYAYKATVPKDLYAAAANGVDIVGPENTADHILGYLAEFKVEKTIACWGRLKTGRGWLLAEDLKRMGVTLYCFKKNLDESPTHPRSLPYRLRPERWTYTERM